LVANFVRKTSGKPVFALYVKEDTTGAQEHIAHCLGMSQEKVAERYGKYLPTNTWVVFSTKNCISTYPDDEFHRVFDPLTRTGIW
jgi:hypothetical protein